MKLSVKDMKHNAQKSTLGMSTTSTSTLRVTSATNSNSKTETDLLFAESREI